MRNYRMLMWFLFVLVACVPTEQVVKQPLLLSKPVYVFHYGETKHDGKEVYAISQVDGTAEIVIPAERKLYSFAVASNGGMAYSTLDGEMYTFDGETHTLLYDAPEDENVYGLAWSPDMAWLAYGIGHDNPPRHSQQSHGAWLYHFERDQHIHLDLNVYNQYTDENGIIQHDFDVEKGIYSIPTWSPDSKTVVFRLRLWEGWGLTWFNLDDPQQPEKLSVDGYGNPTNPSVVGWTADNTQMLVGETFPGVTSGAYLIGRADRQITHLVDNIGEPYYMLWSTGVDPENGASIAYGSTVDLDNGAVQYGELTLYTLDGANVVTPIITDPILCPEWSAIDRYGAPLAQGIVWCGEDAYWLEKPAEPLSPLPELTQLLDQLDSDPDDGRREYMIIVGE